MFDPEAWMLLLNRKLCFLHWVLSVCPLAQEEQGAQYLLYQSLVEVKRWERYRDPIVWKRSDSGANTGKGKRRNKGGGYVHGGAGQHYCSRGSFSGGPVFCPAHAHVHTPISQCKWTMACMSGALRRALLALG